MIEGKLFTDNMDWNMPCWFDGQAIECPLKMEYKKIHGESIDCRKCCSEYKKINVAITNCGQPNTKKFLIDLVLQKIDTKAFLRLNEIKENVVQWVERGSNLFLTSDNIQTGKTTWALKILYRYITTMCTTIPFTINGYYLYVPELLFKLKDYEYKKTQEFKQLETIMKSCPLVIWDGINLQTLTPQEQATLGIYFNKRDLDCLSNIFIGKNISEEDLTIMVGPVLAQRLNIMEHINFRAKSYRGF